MNVENFVSLPDLSGNTLLGLALFGGESRATVSYRMDRNPTRVTPVFGVKQVTPRFLCALDKLTKAFKYLNVMLEPTCSDLSC